MRLDRERGLSTKIERRKRKVEELMSRAGIIEPPRKGGGRLANESIVVLRGPWKSHLTIFDQDGEQIGSAHRYGDEYALRDAEPICTIRKDNESWSGSYFAYSVLGIDGLELGTISREKRARPKMENKSTTTEPAVPSVMGGRDPPRLSSAAANRYPALTLKGRDGRAMATLRHGSRGEVIRNRLSPPDLLRRASYILDHSSCCRYTIEDEPGHEAARITYVRPSLWRNDVSYVLELGAPLAEPLRTLIVATPIVVDNSILSFFEWGTE